MNGVAVNAISEAWKSREGDYTLNVKRFLIVAKGRWSDQASAVSGVPP